MTHEDNLYRRWNFDADDEGIIACKGSHENSEHCEAHTVRLSPHEVLEIINTLRRKCLGMQALLAIAREKSNE